MVFSNKGQPYLNGFMGGVFEKICMDYLYLPSVIGSAPFFYGNLGRWWGNNPKEKRQEEIDLLGIESGSILHGKCKWNNDPIGHPVLTTLIERGNLFYQENKWFYLFSKSGFTESVEEKARECGNICLISLADMGKVSIIDHTKR